MNPIAFLSLIFAPIVASGALINSDSKQEDFAIVLPENIYFNEADRILPHRRNYFYVGKTKETYHRAATICRGSGMKLAELVTIEDQLDYMNALWEKKRDGESFWTGGHRFRGPWKWGLKGPAFKFTFWAKGKPDNKDGDQKCVSTRPKSMEWADIKCDAVLPYVCQQV